MPDYPPGDGGRQGRLFVADALQLLCDQLRWFVFQDVALGAGLQRRHEMIVVIEDRAHDRHAVGLPLGQPGDEFGAVAVA